VLAEVAGLAAQGVKEVTLLGQNVNAWRASWGLDGEASPSDVAGRSALMADFADLLELIHDIPGIERIRYTTSHPKEFTKKLIDAYARLPKLVSHLHLPVQHGSDRVLMAMKRGYTALEFKSIVRRLRAVRPDMALSSDFIVGFPGETDEDHAKLLHLMDEIGFDNSFSFIFSPRPGTPAAALHDDTAHAVKLARLQAVQARTDAHMRRVSESMVGSTQQVLVEGVSRKNAAELMGKTACNRTINFPVPAAAQARLLHQMVAVRVTQAVAHSLRGELVLH
jgi:tRNA-2-methylthio-N6-dimethylallyladenosine synthase